MRFSINRFAGWLWRRAAYTSVRYLDQKNVALVSATHLIRGRLISIFKPAVSAGILLALVAPAHAQSDPLAPFKGFAKTIKQLTRTPAKTAAPSPDPAAASPGSAFDVAQVGTYNTDRAAAALVKNSPETYDIGGMKLFMSPTEVMRIAKAKGLTPVYKPSMNNASFENEVDFKMRELKGGYPGDKRYGDFSYVKLIDAEKNTWSIHFKPSEKGQVVYLIEYLTPWAGRTPNDMSNALYAKYGPPTEGARPQTERYFNLSWCSGVKNCYFPNSKTAPAIMYVSATESGVKLKLDMGVGAALRFEQAIRDAAQARLAKTATKPSF